MNNVDITSMFDSIKNSLNAGLKKNDQKDILRLEAPNSYLGRLIPNIKNPENTFKNYYSHGWKSLATGQYIDTGVCPTTYGEERCPICEKGFALFRVAKQSGKESDKALAKLFMRQEKHMINFYVIDDPKNKENNGQIKILRLGQKLYKKIHLATEGDDAKEFGVRIYDFSEKGCNFKIIVGTNKEGTNSYADYGNSRFTSPCAIDGLTPEKIKAIYEGIFDLDKYVERKSTEEMVKLMNIHIFCQGSNLNKPQEEAPAPEKVVEEDNLPGLGKSEAPKSASAPETPKASPEVTNDKIKDLLKDLDNI